MRRFVLLALTVLAIFQVYAQDTTLSRIILVRHAEKAQDGTSDPPLSQEGRQRAQRLALLLKDVPVGALYSTPYKRTRETLAPVAAAKQLPVNSYEPADAAALPAILAAAGRQSILIAGHSNTIPAMVNSLLKKQAFPDMAESDYGSVWILLRRGDTVIDCTVYHY